MAVGEPWLLDRNSFEQERYAQMLRIARRNGDVRHALDVGCAAGVFTEMLAPHCQRITVLDVMPQAIERARHRTNRRSHIQWATRDIRQFSTAEQFDLIAKADVLYDVNDVAEMHAAIPNLASMLAPNGALVVEPTRDATCRRWGHAAGAETLIFLFNEILSEVERLHCHAESVNEECLLVLFRKPSHSSEQSNRGH
ncbi:SAM-dependent methyltransferase [Bradyrhizobium sp. Pha-3]|uniref:SAM-dependent methyltransferase n=1 Tax=Bradyrhizobium sp. Pha-3 TaxID=208375 RepID=UPI0035D44AC6